MGSSQSSQPVPVAAASYRILPHVADISLFGRETEMKMMEKTPESFQHDILVPAETSIKITQAFEEIGTEVGLLEPDGAKRARRLLFTKRKGGCGTMVRISECTIAMMMADFGEDKPFLLPFDIIESMSILKNYLPASGRASVMITTKSQNLFQPPGTAWAHLKCFDMEEGKHYLLTNIPQGGLDGNEVDSGRVQKIYDTCEELPLALSQVHRFITALNISLNEASRRVT
ncbi:hypothetical protein FOPG_13384 [Fusarium oxysporum f. sp. conglutinans race 2 54008]|uniref:Uncharacterized protein n=1 Tax=Fusarium oxysporum f. sp. conglutinans race 2 54008 TaxID=1089457 RepID=X0H483_FUSOX|nr:hypothetical protein FOPG_13384 [Fusarium oxysporum f. sp. conglutinans race 2 54008]